MPSHSPQPDPISTRAMLGDFSRAPHALMKLKEQGAASEALIDALLAAFQEQALAYGSLAYGQSLAAAQRAKTGRF